MSAISTLSLRRPKSPPIVVANLIDEICDRFEAAWKSGSRPTIADYLVETPADHAPHLFAELVRLDIEYRGRKGESSDIAEYASLYPQFSDVLTGLRDEAQHAQTVTLHSPSGKKLGRYELMRELGGGGFGIVWKAWDTQLQRWVAVKVPSKPGRDPAEDESFLREARAAAELEHPYIVATLDSGKIDGTTFIVSRFVEGITLRSWTKARRLEWNEAARICQQIGEGLDYARTRGVIHRDLKPSNILMERDGIPRIADFGLASRKIGDATIGPQHGLAGTPPYMSPEQVTGMVKLDHRTDVYSLGATLYELLTGRQPFEGDQDAILHQVAYLNPPKPRTLRPEIPKDLETICLKAMEKDRELRYATAGEMAKDFRRFLSDEPILAKPTTKLRRAWQWCRRNRALSTALVATALSTAAACGFALQPAAIPENMHRVLVATNPPGARVVFYRLNDRTGEPDPSQRTEASRGQFSEAHLHPGDYFVVAALDDGRFHEVLRHVPKKTDDRAWGTNGRFWHKSKTVAGALEVPRIEIPSAEVTNGMALLDGDPEFEMGIPNSKINPAHRRPVDAFYINTTELPASKANLKADGTVLGLGVENYRPGGEEAIAVPYDHAVDWAERLGKRLPMEAEYEFAATNRGTTRFPWGNAQITDDQIELNSIGVAGLPRFDRLPTDPPVLGLCTNVAEWTISRASYYPPVNAVVPDSEDKRVVRGAYDPEGNVAALRAEAFDPRLRQFAHRLKRLGLRCVRSAKPHLEAADFGMLK